MSSNRKAGWKQIYDDGYDENFYGDEEDVKHL
jgi:hypothetical protein